MFNSIICFKAGIMSKLCDIYWRQRVMGHWQYILSVNTILFVLHSIISLCSFIIPVRIQSFFFLLLFFGATFLICRGLDLNNVVFLFCFGVFFSEDKKKKKKKRKKISSILSTVMGSLQQRLFEMLSVCRRTVDSGFDFKKTTTTTKKTSGSLLADRCTPPRPQQTCGPIGVEAKGRLSGHKQPHHSTSDWL